RSQVGIPVESTVDLSNPVPVIFNIIIGPKQATFYLLCCMKTISPSLESMVTNPKLTEHPLHHPVKITSGSNVGKEGFVFFFHCFPIDPVHARVVEVIPVYPPGFIKNISPFFTGINFNFYFTCI